MFVNHFQSNVIFLYKAIMYLIHDDSFMNVALSSCIITLVLIVNITFVLSLNTTNNQIIPREGSHPHQSGMDQCGILRDPEP